MTTNIHHTHGPIARPQHPAWRQAHWRTASNLPVAGERGHKMAFIVGINCALWTAVLTAAWLVTHG